MEYADMTVAELLREQKNIKVGEANIKSRKANLQAELARRFGEGAIAAYVAQGKEHGTVRFPQGAITVKVDRRQTVRWDQEKCRALAADMTWEQARHYFDFTFDVKEAVYKALPPGDNFRPALTDARTTKVSEPSFELVPVE